MARYGIQHMLKKVRGYVTPHGEVESLKQAIVELDRRQRLLHAIGQHLTGLQDRQSLVRACASYLRRDLTFPGARVVLESVDDESTPKSNGLFPSEVPAPITLPITFEEEIVG